ncbi:MAG TPA: riboflavin biosynthesis protein RibF [Candidatus Coproplasma stercoravium]|nr:riboflavin biosynthesis protein RibF [Candidatus Coproplasma stercoravium]
MLEIVNYNKDEYNFPALVVLGCFDAVHVGHAELLKKAKLQAKINGLDLGVMMFGNGKGGRQVYTFEERLAFLSGYNAKFVLKIDYNDEFKKTTPAEFLNILEEKINIKGYMSGKDFRFGAGAKGKSSTLKKYAEDEDNAVWYMPVKDVMIDGEKVSTTLIKQYLEEGKIQKANELLGREYFVSGEVCEGHGRGASVLGFPTANIVYPANKVLVAPGVYGVEAEIDGTVYKGVANCGPRPTFGEDAIVLEAYFEGLNENLYGKTLTVKFLNYIRGIKKFENADELKAQIASDATKVGEPDASAEEVEVSAPAAEVAAETPVEEPAPEVVEEVPAEEPAPEVVEEVPAEEPVSEVAEETPVEESAPEVAEEVPAEEPVSEVAEESPAEEPAPEVAEEVPAEEPAPEVAEESPVEKPAPEVTGEVSDEAAEAAEEVAAELFSDKEEEPEQPAPEDEIAVTEAPSEEETIEKLVEEVFEGEVKELPEQPEVAEQPEAEEPETPVEESAPEVAEETPVEEPAPEVVEEVPAEEPAPEVVEEVPAEEPSTEEVDVESVGVTAEDAEEPAEDAEEPAEEEGEAEEAEATEEESEDSAGSEAAPRKNKSRRKGRGKASRRKGAR